MGIGSWLSAPFKAVGKAFKAVGKGIMKGFKAVGKTMNKLGIVGQIGMMMLTSGIASAAFSSFGSMASGFFQSAAQGSGFFSKLVTSIATGVRTIVSAPLEAGKSIFSNVTQGVLGTLGDVGKYITSKLPGGADPLAWKDTWGSISNRIQGAKTNIFGDTRAAFSDAWEFTKDVIPGGDAVKSDYRTFTPKGSENPITKNLAYNTSATNKLAEAGITTTKAVPPESLFKRGVKGAATGFKESVNFKNAGATGGATLTQSLLNPDEPVENPVGGIQIPTDPNRFKTQLWKANASSMNFLNGLMTDPQSVFKIQDLIPTTSETYKLWSGQTPTLSYV